MSEHQPLRRGLDVDREVAVALILAPLVMAALNYLARPRVFTGLPLAASLPEHERALAGLLWWSGWSGALYLIVPALVLKVGRRRLRDYGLRLPAWRRELLLYPVMYAVVVLLMLVSARGESFLRVYPLYPYAAERPGLWALFLVAYGLQFFALEFFFRGYLIFALRRVFGDAAVLVSAVPYCMIHFAKPMPEALGSLVAGIVLGALALRTGSIVGGVAVHCGVAWTMDLLAFAVKTGRL